MTLHTARRRGVACGTGRSQLPAPVRSVPLRVGINDGEALDSWMDALAARNSVTTRRLLSALELPPSLTCARGLLHDVAPEVLRTIERLTGLPTGRLDRAVLDHYTPLGWSPLSGSRYCPACLNASGGRWSLRWRLPWVFACTTHRLLLLGRCPRCARPPRRHLSGGAGLHPPGSCPNGAPGRGQLCRGSLTDAPARRLDDADPLLHAQRLLDAHLDAFDAGDSNAAVLADVHIFGDWVRGYAPWRRRVTGTPGPDRPGQHDRQQLNTLPTRQAAALAAYALTLATAETDEQLRDQLNILFAPAPAAAGTASRGIVLGPASHWTATLPHPHAVRIIGILDTQMAPLERLRWRSPTDSPQPPRRATVADQRARWVPQAIWPDWLIRLQPATGYFCDEYAAAMSRCLLIPGRLERNVTLISAELHPHNTRLASNIISRLRRHGHHGVLAALARLADYLDANASPIDYRRRRSFITPHTLTEHDWIRYCADATVHPGQARRRLHDARRYVFTLLTGADLNDPCHELAYRSAADRSKYRSFPALLNSALRQALHQHAREQLDTLSIDEPLTWSPPSGICSGIDLPGPDPRDIDHDTVAELLRNGHTTRVIADKLATSVEHVRYAITMLDQQPDQTPGWLHQQQATEILTRELFQREYIHGGKTLTDLHKQTGFSRTTLARHAKRAGIQLRRARIPFHIDEAWLEQQYVHHGKPFYDIAAELGVSGMTVILAARRHGITARPAGVASHPDYVIVHNDLPPDIRAAVEGQLHGWQRLRRFRDAMTYPSITAATEAAGACPGSLTTQFKRLERDIDTQLFHRANTREPMRLTDRGAALLADLQQPPVEALIEKYGQPPRRKRKTHENQEATNP
jgi:DNA-binding CsgD family transcriptional regulator